SQSVSGHTRFCYYADESIRWSRGAINSIHVRTVETLVTPSTMKVSTATCDAPLCELENGHSVSKRVGAQSDAFRISALYTDITSRIDEALLCIVRLQAFCRSIYRKAVGYSSKINAERAMKNNAVIRQ